MTLLELLEAANKGYPDGDLARHYDGTTGKHKMPEPGWGDTLANFIVWELGETFDPESSFTDQIHEATTMLQRAKADLDGVLDALYALEVELDGKEAP